MARPRKNVVKDQNALLTPDNVVEIPVEEQPYPLPEGWKWVRLSSFADCLDKFRKPINADERAVREGTIPYYGATGQVGWIDDYLTNEHLVLVGEDGAPFFDILKNKSYIIEGKSWVNNHAHILRSFSGKNGNIYLMHYLNIFNYSGYVNGTTRLKLTQKSLNAIPIPLPPIDEQQCIVDRIEALFAKLDEAREKAEAILDGFESRKAAILHKAFTGELTAKWREKNGLKKGNKAIKIKDILLDIKYGTSEKSDYTYTGLPVIRIPNIIDNTIDLDDLKFLKSNDSSNYDLVEKMIFL